MGFWKIFVPVLIAVWTWHATETSKIEWEQRKGKEQSYQELLKASYGFYENVNDDKSKKAFLEQVRICWLYAPDKVIRQAYAFLSSVQIGHTQNQDEQKQKMGELIQLIREDMLSGKLVTKTTLKADDFQHLSVSKSHP